MANFEIPQGGESLEPFVESGEELSPETREILTAVEADLAPEIAAAEQVADPAEKQSLLAKTTEKAKRLFHRYGAIVTMAAMPLVPGGAQAGEVKEVGSVAELRAELALARESRKAGESQTQQAIDLRQQTESEVRTDAKIELAHRELDIKEIKTIEQIDIKRAQVNQRIKESDAKIALAQQKQNHKERMDLLKEARRDREQAMDELKELNKMERDCRKQDLKELEAERKAEIKNRESWSKIVHRGVGDLKDILKDKK